VVLLEFLDGRPFTVITETSPGHGDECNFEYSKAYDTLCWQHVGSGSISLHVTNWVSGPATYWAADGIDVHADEGAIRLAELPPGYSEAELFEFSEGETVSCSVCKDNFPDDCPCDHLAYLCDGDGWCGVGADRDPDEHKASFAAVLEMMGLASELRAALSVGNYRFHFYGDMFGVDGLDVHLNGTNYGDAFDDMFTEEMEEIVQLGVWWLLTLERGVTTEAEKLTIGWIDEWLEGNQERSKGDA
jgi:hypothetical protein